MRRFIPLIVLSVLFLGPIPAYADPITWTANGHQYEFYFSEGISWEDANAAVTALGNGWYLATITSQAEQDWIVAQFLTLTSGGWWEYWLGAFQHPLEVTAPDAGWMWVTGEAWNFTNWVPGEPNDMGYEPGGTEMGEWNLSIYGPSGVLGGWNDESEPCAGYFAERDYDPGSAQPVPEPSTLALLGLGFVGLIGYRHRLKH